jgi:hypothetical protein
MDEKDTVDGVSRPTRRDGKGVLEETVDLPQGAPPSGKPLRA